MQNIEEALAAMEFPEPVPAVPEAEAVALAETQTGVVEVPPVEEMIPGEKEAEAKKEGRKVVEEVEEDEHAKDGVSLDELFQMKPEMFQPAEGAEDESSDDKKKGKKGKKKGVALEFDEKLGEVVTRKKHKRGDGGGDDEAW